MKAVLGMLGGVMVLAMTGTAAAEVELREYGRDGNSAYKFRDELVGSGVQGPKGGSIIVRPRAWRTGLLRPRAHFVPEMLKSVENL